MQFSIEQTKRTTVIILTIVIIGSVGVFIASYLFGEHDVVVPPVSGPTDTQTEVDREPGVDPWPNDMDRDGIEDGAEVELGLSPVLPDTDGDGIEDKMEIDQWKTDPLKFDTDGDGYGDGWEVLGGYSPTGPGAIGE